MFPYVTRPNEKWAAMALKAAAGRPVVFRQALLIFLLAGSSRALAEVPAYLWCGRDTCEWRATWKTWCPDDYCPKPWCFGQYRQPSSFRCVPQTYYGYPTRDPGLRQPAGKVSSPAPLRPSMSMGGR